MHFVRKSHSIAVAGVMAFAAVSVYAQTQPDAAPQPAANPAQVTTGAGFASGIDLPSIDPAIRATDDFYTHANGKWLATTTIPADKPSWSPAYVLHEGAQENLRLIIEEAAGSTSAAPNTEARKVGDLYKSFMDEARIEELKMKPLAQEFAAIDRIKDESEIPALLARLKQIDIATPVDLDIDQDKRNSTAYVAYLSQAGLGLPDRDYYLDNDDAIGEALGQVYVTKHFPPASKARMEKLVTNLLAAHKQSIDGLEWMGPETKKEAHAKLAKITTKIGYPDKWRDYSKLDIQPDDLVGNVMRANRFEFDRNLAKLGKPIDRSEWYMTPQTVNAYYLPSMNEIVFPAAYLQPPNFNPAADDAANCGTIGRTIGHEISHAFDDSGSQYDDAGNLREWWTAEDHKRFTDKTKSLVAQFDAYSPLPGYFVNGKLTLGENIADLSGLAIAYKAYHLSLGGKEAPIINGMTGDERFFLNYAQSHREKTRDEIQIVSIKTDPHSPDVFRVNGPLSNLDAFYETFKVKQGDKMFRPPKERVSIW